MPARRELCDAALAALAEATVEGQLVRLHRQLDPDAYAEVNEALKRLGGRWKGGRTQAHVFPDHIDPEPLVHWVAAAGEMPPANPTQLYPTPKDIADLVVQCAKLEEARFCEEPLDLLEPSAGLGGLLRALYRADEEPRFRRIDAVEIHPANASYLRKYLAARDPRLQVHEADFLKWTPCPVDKRGYHICTLNPPFQNTAYLRHAWKAWECLAPYGRIAGIAPATFVTNDLLPQLGIDLRILIARWGGWEMLEKGAFAESGTDVATVVFWAEKPAPHWISESDRPTGGFANGWTSSVAINAIYGDDSAYRLSEELKPKVLDGRMTHGEAKTAFKKFVMSKRLDHGVVHESLVDWDQLLGHFLYYYGFPEAPRTRGSTADPTQEPAVAPAAPAPAPVAPAAPKARQRPPRAAQEPAAPSPAPTPPPTPSTPVRVVQTRLI